MKQKTKTNLWVDITIFIVFLIVYEQEATGTAIHEWLGISLGIIFIIHIILHWEWLATKTKLFFMRMKTESRINYILDMLIFIGFTTVIFTGLMISEHFLPTFGFKAVQSHFWQNIHVVSVDITLFLTALHFALHWKWIVKNFRRHIICPLKNKSLTNKISEQVRALPGTSLSFNFSKFIKIAYQLVIILALSGLISFGWYAATGSISAEANLRENRQRGDQGRVSGFESEVSQRSEQFSGQRGRRHGEEGNHSGRGNHQGRRNHEEGGFTGIELLKNLMIFSVITLIVVLISNIISRKKNIKYPISG